MAGLVHFFEPSRFASSTGAITSATASFYYTGTTNPAPIYSDKALTIPATNPVVIAAGAIPPRIYLDPSISYRRRIVFGDASVQDADPVYPSNYATFSDLSANGGSSLVTYKAPLTGSVARTTAAVFAERVSVKDFGAVGDGTTDDAAAFNAALSAIKAAGGGTLYVPAATYRIKSQISLTCNAQQHIRIVGDGPYQSTLDFSTASVLGLAFASTTTTANQMPMFQVEGLGLITSRDDAGTAISVSYASASNIDQTVLIKDVLISQNIDRISDQGVGYGYWSSGVYINNARNSEIQNLHAIGEMNRTPNSAKAIALAGESTAFVCSNSLLLEWSTGVDIVGTCEGIYLSNTDIVYCRYGVLYIIASGAEPQFTAIGCSFNVANVGVWLSNVQQSVISGCLFYAASVLDSGTWPSWTGVLFAGANSRFNKIADCTFAKENGRTGDTTTCIDFNGGRCYSAVNNHFFGFSGNALTYGIIVRSGVSSTLTAENIYEYVTNFYTNSGTTSIRQPIVQAGTVTVSTGGSVTFPSAFPNSVTSVVACHRGTNTALNVAINNPTVSGFDVYHNGGGASVVDWVAVGF